jgi:outer membrane protein assembly factor BamB
VHLLAETDSSELGQIPVTDAGPARQLVVGDTVLVWQGGTLTAVDAGTGAAKWQQPARGLPTTMGKTVPGALLVPGDGAFVQRSLASGDEVGRSAAPDVPDGGEASRVGPVVVYRVGDRVLAYR